MMFLECCKGTRELMWHGSIFFFEGQNACLKIFHLDIWIDTNIQIYFMKYIAKLLIVNKFSEIVGK